MTASEGLLFVATGRRYLHEAAISAMASRQWLNGRPISVVTDYPELAIELGCFSCVETHPNPQGTYRDKIQPLLDLPYSRTLFLDTDARLAAPIDPLFHALGRSHLAAAHAPVRLPDECVDEGISPLFPEFNSGVLLMRRSWRQHFFIRLWLKTYDNLNATSGQVWDQASLRSTIWALQSKMGLRLTVLPPEANLRTTKPWIAGKGLAVHVVHGRVQESEWPSFLQYLNGDVSRFRSWSEWLQLNPASSIRPKLPPDPFLS